ncbi:hypothetical protein ACL03H_13825 [Saccharopolyspora sp. MS10]|uniref:hypothetical protein n=1 Tax=Saccharopolyspora sp. MS10 TaxID=3385973 RepID=UPI00399FDA19
MIRRTLLCAFLLLVVSISVLPNLVDGSPWAVADYVTAAAMVAAFVLFGVEVVRSFSRRES